MGPEIKLIERYKNALDNDDYLIWCNKKYNQNRYKGYDSDTVLKNFLSNTTGHSIDDLPWQIRRPKGLWLTYSVSNEEKEIMLGDRNISFDVSKIYRTVKHIEDKKFLLYLIKLKHLKKLKLKNQKSN